MRITTYFAGTLLLVACSHGGSTPPPATPESTGLVSERHENLGRLEPTPVAEQAPPVRQEPPAVAQQPGPAGDSADPSFAGAVDPAHAPVGSPTSAAGASDAAAGAHGAAARAPTRQENELRERIQSRLLSEQKLSYTARRVRVEVSQNDVTVQGEVRTAREKSDVEQLIQHIEGVRRVNNQLAVIDQTRPNTANGPSMR
jgi:hypothetical protein